MTDANLLLIAPILTVDQFMTLWIICGLALVWLAWRKK
jgi:hypothetical protein